MIKSKTEEVLVSFETAALAKEKGFPQIYPLPYYSERVGYEDENRYAGKTVKHEVVPVRILTAYPTDSHEKEHCKAPTQTMLQKWIRETRNLHPDIGTTVGENYASKWVFYGIEILNGKEGNVYFADSTIFDSYEEALELALQEMLHYGKLTR